MNSISTKKKLFAGLVAILLAFTLSSCVKMKMDFEIKADEQVAATFDFGVEKSVAGLSGSAATGEDICKEFGSDVNSPELKREPYQDDKYVGCKVSGSGQLKDLTGNMSEEGGIIKEGDVYTFKLKMSDDELEKSGVPASSMGSVFSEFSISVTFPGKVLEHNGSSTVEGHTVTWTDIKDFASQEGLVAKGEASAPKGMSAEGPAGLPIWAWILIGVGVLAVVGVIIGIAVGQGRKKTKNTPTDNFPPQGPGPNQPGFDPNQQGFTPSQPGFDQNQPGFDPSQQGFGPNQPGFDPSQPGFDPNQSGFDSNQPGPTA